MKYNRNTMKIQRYLFARSTIMSIRLPIIRVFDDLKIFRNDILKSHARSTILNKIVINMKSTKNKKIKHLKFSY